MPGWKAPRYTYDRMPKEMTDLDQWILWKGRKLKSGKIEKKPYQVTGDLAKTSDSTTFSSFEDCLDVYAEGDYTGIGFVVTKKDPFVFIDGDGVLRQNRQLTKWGSSIFTPCLGYVAKSVSGRGVHVIVKGKKSCAKCSTRITNSKGEDRGEVGVYEHSRFIALTGKALPTKDDVTDDQELIDHCEAVVKAKRCFHRGSKPPAAAVEGVATQGSSAPSPKLSDDDVLSIALKHMKFADLHDDGLIDEYGGDVSAAVFAWQNLITFYTQDFSQITRLFKRSALFSQKWEKKWKRLGKEQHDRIMLEKQESGGEFYSAPDAEEDGEITARMLELVDEHFPKRARELFSNDVMYRDSGKWLHLNEPDVIGFLKLQCMELGGGDAGYANTNIPFVIGGISLGKVGPTLKPQLLIDIPSWDGVDRIGEMCGVMNFEDERITTAMFEYFFKDWWAQMFRRAWSPLAGMEQNRCILLNGAQGIGKDIWVEQFATALDFYATYLTVEVGSDAERRMKEAIFNRVLVIISEFDKTHNIKGAAILKDLITAASFDIRRSYAKNAARYPNRCSFIGAANPTSVLTDATGNRRFLVFQLKGAPGEAIRWTYPVGDKEHQAQLVAQGLRMAQEARKSDERYEELMQEITAENTPEAAEQDILEVWEGCVQSGPKYCNHMRYFSLREVGEHMRETARLCGVNYKQVRHALRTGGCFYKHDERNFWGCREDLAVKDIRVRIKRDMELRKTIQTSKAFGDDEDFH